ncbi:hypothetical protein AVEN_116631-1 [Araneus ventricosus]|uniref:Uncharacterized protein n=1 Tax=Araneus ventricosus TaxID=182803 RepID=A0A4Y2SUF0_ARAVE|nr:hypothetical protein AVEN_254859-1 [Araneus ventricosus]GBN93635.1 hypothetical protein AVEN_116631-1 [Araneus ventricosus]
MAGSDAHERMTSSDAHERMTGSDAHEKMTGSHVHERIFSDLIHATLEIFLNAGIQHRLCLPRRARSGCRPIRRSCNAGYSGERKSKPYVLTTGLYSTQFSRKIRQNSHGCSKVCFETRFKVSHRTLLTLSPLPQHGGFLVSFQASTRGPNVGRSIVLPVSLHRGPKLESTVEVLGFECGGISSLPIVL